VIKKIYILAFFILGFLNFSFGQNNVDSTSALDTCELTMPMFHRSSCPPVGPLVLKVKCNCIIKDFNFKLYNRWGNLVDSSINPYELLFETKLPQGTYFYILSGRFFNGNYFIKKDFLSIGREYTK